MRKLILVVVSCVFLLAFNEAALAADALFRMLHADEVESFKKDQDALVQIYPKTGINEQVPKTFAPEAYLDKPRTENPNKGVIIGLGSALSQYQYCWHFDEKENCSR